MDDKIFILQLQTKMCQLGFKKKKTRLSSFQSHTGILGGIDMDWVLVNSIGHTADWFKSMGLDWSEGAQARSRGAWL